MFRPRVGLLMLSREGGSNSKKISPLKKFSMRATGAQLQGHLCGCQTLVQLQTLEIWGFGSLGVRTCLGNWQGVWQVSATLWDFLLLLQSLLNFKFLLWLKVSLRLTNQCYKLRGIALKIVFSQCYPNFSTPASVQTITVKVTMLSC